MSWIHHFSDDSDFAEDFWAQTGPSKKEVVEAVYKCICIYAYTPRGCICGFEPILEVYMRFSGDFWGIRPGVYAVLKTSIYTLTETTQV